MPETRLLEDRSAFLFEGLADEARLLTRADVAAVAVAGAAGPEAVVSWDETVPLEQRTSEPGSTQPSMLPGFGQWTVSSLPSASSTSAKKRL